MCRTSVTNGSISYALVFSHFPTLMTNGVALPVCVTEILIYCFIETFPALFLVINMYPSVWRPFHHMKLHADTLANQTQWIY